jgi:hypothetical protein
MFTMLRTLLVTLIAAALLSAPIAATVTVPTEFREIVADASVILRGHITDVRGLVEPDRGVETVGTIGVDEVLKGPPREFISIRVPGGTVGRYRSIMVGAPSLRLSDQGVFFLKQDSAGAWRPVGLAMGIYRIQLKPGTGLLVVDPVLASGVTTPAGTVVRGSPARRWLAVPEFESLVRVVIASQSRASQQVRR